MCDVEIIFRSTPLKIVQIVRKTARCNIWMTPHQNNDKQMTKIKADDDDDAEEREFQSNYGARPQNPGFSDQWLLVLVGDDGK